jgi:hypothetical protein
VLHNPKLPRTFSSREFFESCFARVIIARILNIGLSDSTTERSFVVADEKGVPVVGAMIFDSYVLMNAAEDKDRAALGVTGADGTARVKISQYGRATDWKNGFMPITEAQREEAHRSRALATNSRKQCC